MGNYVKAFWCKKCKMANIRTPTKEKPSHISNITSAILFFLSVKILKLNGHPKYFGMYQSWWKHQMCFNTNMVHSSPKNIKSRLCQYQACYNMYLLTTHLGPLIMSILLTFSFVISFFLPTIQDKLYRSISINLQVKATPLIMLILFGIFSLLSQIW